MPCKNCGFLLNDGDLICPSCGLSIEKLDEMDLQEGVKEAPSVKKPSQSRVPGYEPIIIPPLESQNSYSKRKFKGLIIVVVIFLTFSLFFLLLKQSFFRSDLKEETITDRVINYSGYTFTIPLDYHVYNGLDGLTITDKTEDLVFTVQLSSKTYLSCLHDKEELQKKYEELGFTVGMMQVQDISDVSYLTFELGKDEYKMLAALRSAPTSDTFVLLILFKDNNVNLEVLNDIESILKKVKVA